MITHKFCSWNRIESHFQKNKNEPNWNQNLAYENFKNQKWRVFLKSQEPPNTTSTMRNYFKASDVQKI